jgi:post-segregation antitoxin (ccd killing protein)
MLIGILMARTVYDARQMHCNITLPVELRRKAEKYHINISRVARVALQKIVSKKDYEASIPKELTDE